MLIIANLHRSKIYKTITYYEILLRMLYISIVFQFKISN